MEWLKKIWKAVGAWCYRYIGGLFMDEKNGVLTVSLGRVAMVLMLIMFIWVWRRDVLDNQPVTALPDGMIEVFYVLASYVFGSKVVSGLRSKWANGKETEIKPPDSPQP